MFHSLAPTPWPPPTCPYPDHPPVVWYAATMGVIAVAAPCVCRYISDGSNEGSDSEELALGSAVLDSGEEDQDLPLMARLRLRLAQQHAAGGL